MQIGALVLLWVWVGGTDLITVMMRYLCIRNDSRVLSVGLLARI